MFRAQLSCFLKHLVDACVLLGGGHEELTVDRASVLLSILLAYDLIVIDVVTLRTDYKLDGVDMRIVIDLICPVA